MAAERFLDTNVLVYAALGRRDAPEKQRRARDLMARGPFATSTQVLQEFFVTATRKSAKPLSPAEALEWVELVGEQPCVTVDRTLIAVATELSARYRISYWDAAILAAAERAGAAILCTEDLNHGQCYGAVRAENPFRDC